jgi:hypothetical protein
MNKKPLVLMLFLLSVFGLICFAQYTGSQLERKPPENLHPEPGPGEILIIEQLRQTNNQLQEQTRLLTEQNQILRQTLEQLKKQK